MSEKSFWKSIPDVLKYVAGILGGIGAIIFALQQLGVLNSENKLEPKIVSFEATRERINVGETTKLVWVVKNAKNITINDQAVGLKGYLLEEPKSTTKYILIASNSKGSTTQTQTVEVVTPTPPIPQLPKIDRFDVSKDTIDKGESVTLRWHVTGAKEVHLNDRKVAVSGNEKVTPKKTSDFKLWASNNDGSASDEVTVTVLELASPPSAVTEPESLPLLPGVSISFKNKQIEIFKDRARFGLVPFRENTTRKYGVGEVVGNQLKIILAPDYSEVIIPEQSDPTAVKNGMIEVRKGKLWGMFDRTGRKVTPISYDHISPFYDGFAVVTRKGKEGIININGKTIVPADYDQVGQNSDERPAFVNDMAPVGRDGKFGFVNKAGKLVVPLILDYSTNFGQWGNPNTARAKSNGKWVTCDKSGNCKSD